MRYPFLKGLLLAIIAACIISVCDPMTMVILSLASSIVYALAWLILNHNAKCRSRFRRQLSRLLVSASLGALSSVALRLAFAFVGQ